MIHTLKNMQIALRAYIQIRVRPEPFDQIYQFGQQIWDTHIYTQHSSCYKLMSSQIIENINF
jgi:hypothetical protein